MLMQYYAYLIHSLEAVFLQYHFQIDISRQWDHQVDLNVAHIISHSSSILL